MTIELVNNWGAADHPITSPNVFIYIFIYLFFNSLNDNGKKFYVKEESRGFLLLRCDRTIINRITQMLPLA